MSNWTWLLRETFEGLRKLDERGSPVPAWVLGGGTSLMVAFRHRLSKDIDAFIDDPQYPPYLDPGMGAEGIWGCEELDRQSNALKLVYDHGEIDFIVAPAITDLAPSPCEIDGHTVALAHPVEVCVSKMFHRARTLKIRDIFDIAVVDQSMSQLLSENLVHLSGKKSDLEARLGEITPSYYAKELDEIEVMPGWEHIPTVALGRMGAIVGAIPRPSRRP
ncbi:hypothetical protein BN1110_05919 [bacterium YEK0313]|nr:hypothetical protein BN1110_05919 [bacterium YEK0313]